MKPSFAPVLLALTLGGGSAFAQGATTQGATTQGAMTQGAAIAPDTAKRFALGDLDNAETALRAGKIADARNYIGRAEVTLLNAESAANPGLAATGTPLPERGVLDQVRAAREALASNQTAPAQQNAERAITSLRQALLRAEQPR